MAGCANYLFRTFKFHLVRSACMQMTYINIALANTYIVETKKEIITKKERIGTNIHYVSISHFASCVGRFFNLDRISKYLFSASLRLSKSSLD